MDRLAFAGIRSLPVAAALAGGIFLIDTLSSLQFAVASLYVIVVLIAAHDLHRRGVVLTGVTCAFLTVVSYVLVHGFAVDGTAPLRSAVSLVLILIPLIPGVRSIPRVVPVYRWIWRDYYRRAEGG